LTFLIWPSSNVRTFEESEPATSAPN